MPTPCAPLDPSHRYLFAPEMPHLLVGFTALANPAGHHNIAHALRHAGIPVRPDASLWLAADSPMLRDLGHALAVIAPWDKTRWLRALAHGTDAAYFKASTTLYRCALRLLDPVSLHVLLAHPVHDATCAEHLSLTERITALKHAGFDLDERDPLLRTPLHVAAHSANDALACALLASGAKPDSADAWGRTPLHTAVDLRHGPIQEALIAAEADIDCTDQAGNTPLHLAALANDVDAIQRLLEAYACAHILNRATQRPIDVASSQAAHALLSRAGSMINLRLLNPRLPLTGSGSGAQSGTPHLPNNHNILKNLAGFPQIRITHVLDPRPDATQWDNLGPLLQECGVDLKSGTSVWVEKGSLLADELRRGLMLKSSLKTLGTPLSSVLFSGKNRADVESLCALIRCRLTHPEATRKLAHRMAVHARCSDDTFAHTGISLAERLRLLESALDHALPPTNGTRTRWLAQPDGEGRTPLELAMAHGNRAMEKALREVLADTLPDASASQLPKSLPLFATEEAKTYHPTPSLSSLAGPGSITPPQPFDSDEVSSLAAFGTHSSSSQINWSAHIAPQHSRPTSSIDRDEAKARGNRKLRDTPGSESSAAG